MKTDFDHFVFTIQTPQQMAAIAHNHNYMLAFKDIRNVNIPSLNNLTRQRIADNEFTKRTIHSTVAFIQQSSTNKSIQPDNFLIMHITLKTRFLQKKLVFNVVT